MQFGCNVVDNTESTMCRWLYSWSNDYSWVSVVARYSLNKLKINTILLHSMLKCQSRSTQKLVISPRGMTSLQFRSSLREGTRSAWYATSPRAHRAGNPEPDGASAHTHASSGPLGTSLPFVGQLRTDLQGGRLWKHSQRLSTPGWCARIRWGWLFRFDAGVAYIVSFTINKFSNLPLKWSYLVFIAIL